MRPRTSLWVHHRRICAPAEQYKNAFHEKCMSHRILAFSLFNHSADDARIPLLYLEIDEFSIERKIASILRNLARKENCEREQWQFTHVPCRHLWQRVPQFLYRKGLEKQVRISLNSDLNFAEHLKMLIFVTLFVTFFLIFTLLLRTANPPQILSRTRTKSLWPQFAHNFPHVLWYLTSVKIQLSGK